MPASLWEQEVKETTGRNGNENHCNFKPKGRRGKTTTAVSLSVALARQGKRVLLIDADSQADATKYLGVENPDELQNTLSTAMHCIINDLPYKTGEYIRCV